jgi:zinc protease
MKSKYIIIGLAFFQFIMNIFAQDLSTLLRQPLPDDPNLISGTLENGLKYVIRVNKQPANRVELRLIVDIGAVDEDDDQQGLAHFTEHMVFKGTTSFSKQQLINYLNSIGMGFGGGLNAFTSQENTAYTLSAPTDKPEQLEKAFQILSEMADKALFDDIELEEERGVIIEEWRMYQGASQRIQDRIQRVILKDSRYAERTPIGVYEILANFQPKTIKRFYNDWYRPDLQTVLVIGDVDTAAIENLLKKYFGTKPLPENPRPKETYEVPDHITPRAIVANDDEMSYTSVLMVWKHEPKRLKNVEDYLQKTIIQLGTDMLQNRLEEYTRMLDAPFSYANSFHFNMTRTKSGFYLNAYTSEEKVLAATTALLTEAERIRIYGFTPGELQRAKSRLQTRLERSVADKDNEISSRLTWSYLRRIIENQSLLSEEQELQLFTFMKQIIQLDNVNHAMASLITDENFVITVTGPEKEGLLYPSEEELLAVREQVKQSPITAYIDDTIDEPLMTNIPKPGKIRKEKILKDSGIKRWELSNGAIVYTKKTEYKNDEVLFTAISPGGYSLYPPEEAITSQHAASIVFESGFGEFDKVNLDKALAGSIISLNPYINLENEGFNGNFAPRNMEQFFQMLYQYVTNFRKCEDSFSSYLQKQITFTENRLLDPEQVFWDSVGVIIHDKNPYMKPQTAKELRNLEFNRAIQIYSDRFGDFSDFTFFFVGNFDESLLKDYCKTYLATLPIMKRKETYRNVVKSFPEGQKKRVIYLGRDEKSIVFAHNHGKYTFSNEAVSDLNALQMLMFEKLRLNIREAKSGVYYVGMQANLQKIPAERYSLQTILFCAPDRYNELFEATYATLDSVRAGFVTDEDANYVKSTLLKNLDSQTIRNQYYLNQMKDCIWNGLPVDDYLKRKEQIERITRDSLIRTAQTFMTHEKNLMQIVRLPRE